MREPLRGIFPIDKKAYIGWEDGPTTTATKNETFIAEREFPDKNVVFELVGYISDNGDVWYSILPFPIDMPKFQKSESEGWDYIRKELLSYTKTTKKKNLKQIMVETGLDVFDFAEKDAMEMVGDEIHIKDASKINRQTLLTDIAQREGVWSETLLAVRDAVKEMKSLKVATKQPSIYPVESIIFQSAYELATSAGLPHHIALKMASDTCEESNKDKKGQADGNHKIPESLS